MEEDPLKYILRASNFVGHTSVCQNDNRFYPSNKRAKVINICILLSLLILCEYVMYKTKDQNIEAYGLWILTLVQLDIYMTFGLNYLMVLNGTVQLKNFIKLFNLIGRIIQKSHFAKKGYKKL